MNKKQITKSVTCENKISNILLAFKIIFNLIPQIALVYLINGLMEGWVTNNIIYMIGTIMGVSFILKEVCYYCATRSCHTGAYNKLTDLRLQIIEHLKNLNLGFFKSHNIGELTNIVQHDVEQVEVYLAHGLPEIMSATLLPILIFIAMVFIDIRLAILMIVGVPFLFFVKILSKKSMNKGFAVYFKQENQMREELMDYVKNIAVIKAFSREEEVSQNTLKTARGYVYWVKKSMKTVTIPMGLMNISMEIGVALVMILGSMLLHKGEITVSKFILSIILSSTFTFAIGKMATLQHFSVVFKQAIDNICKVLTVPINKNKKDIDLKAGDIKFENVRFKYNEKGFRLYDINLEIKENTVNAFVGESGCGKSTIANLLMGFWDVNNGNVSIGGKNIANYNQEKISALIGSVQQEVILFDLSIFENIAIGKSGATKEEVINAAKKARCHEFITELPKGYDTKVGEMGIKLSGGEKQRISIARMILKNAPILVLDEAMAAVDSENERLIGEAIEELRKDKTVITIAHHLNTIRDSDQIIVMNKGEVIGTGTHNELMKQSKFYRNMVIHQNKVDCWDLKEVV